MSNKAPPLWKHQKDCIDLAQCHNGYGIFFEQGCGKTRVAIELCRHHFIGEKRVMRTLILCPKIVVTNWKREFLQYSNVPETDIKTLTGTGKQRYAMFMDYGFWKYQLDKPYGRIFVMNYESLLMKGLFEKIQRWEPEILICDESHRLKAHNAKRSKLTVKLSEKAKIRFLLSGTPVLNTPMDVFSQFKILDHGESFGNNFFAFRARYFYDKNRFMTRESYFPNWVAQPDCEKRMNRKIAKKSIRVLKKDCLDLPPLIRQRVECEMSAKQAKAYEAMKKDCIAYLNGQAVVAQLAFTKLLRLQQIVSGYYQPDGGRSQVFDAVPRLSTIEELLEDLTPSHKVIIWAVFQKNYEMLRWVTQKLKLKTVEIHGLVSEKMRDQAVDLFNRNDNYRVLIGHPGSGGIGINLVAASYAIFYSRGFSLEHDLQAEARNHRGGSEIHEKITRIDIVTPGTIDELITERLAKKSDMGDALLQAFKEGFK